MWETKAGCMTECPDVFQSNTVYFRHWFVESCKCLLVILGFLMRRKKMMYFIRPRNYPTWQGIAGHFTITGKLGEKPTCVNLLRHKTYKTYWWNLYLSILKLHCMKRASRVSKLSSICSTGKIVYIQIIRTDLWSFQAH